MKAGVWNLLFGLLGVGLGLSGKFALLGTNSPTALVVVGGLLASWGLVQIIRSRGQQQR
jgi:hypothetical protein